MMTRAGVFLVLLLLPAVAGAQTRTGTTPTGLYYEVSGSGEPVVLIHAFSVDRRMWAPQMRPRPSWPSTAIRPRPPR